MSRYNPKEIEPKWQKAWEEQGIYQASEDPAKPKKYILEYFPYPSGAAMHVGHVRNYTIGDATARFMRMQGFNVLHPMGWDAFGLPAENYAIKNKVSPRKAIDDNTKRFREQLMRMGFSYDWSREIDSTDPAYYKWTQWFFLLLFKRGLAYQQESLQWWCPVDKTVLANEQVENGKCWRCGNAVEKKALKQWFFKITEYADRLLADLDNVDWSDGIKTMQRNWIGRSSGAEVDFKVEGSKGEIKVYTTRPDTLFGATFMVLAPEHPLVDKITIDGQKSAVASYQKATLAKSDIERQAEDKEKTGVFTGAFAINPVNDEKIPVWVADYVLYGYGTGAIMAVPAHDERDFDFAKKFDLPIVPVIEVEKTKTALILHGTGGDNQKAWIPWLKRALKAFGYEVIAPNMPDAEFPELDKWLKELAKYKEKINENSIVVGHSLGCPTALQFIQQNELKVGQLLLVGPTFPDMDWDKYQNDHPEPNYSNIAKVSQVPVDWSYIRKAVTSTTVFYSTDDPYIPSELLEKNFPKYLPEAKLVKFANKVHFNHGAGIVELQEALGYLVEATRGEGSMINSGRYDTMSSDQARELIIADLSKGGTATERTNYKIRDWLISRQRYWGAPIPIIHCPKDGAVAVPDDQLPVELPDLKTFEPTGDGRSPLARVESFVKTKCPKCGEPAERETDTMDGFACSSWYFLRFADPHNAKEAFSKEKAKFWLPVDDYIGGAEHAVMHLLYARFWTKVMFDEGLIDFEEPFSKLRNHGMILAPDGQKMSKSKNNTIEPEGLIDQGYGADSIRIMELFIGPWNQSANWSVEGMGGAFRFLQRIWTLTQEHLAAKDSGNSDQAAELSRATHLVTKRVSEDLLDMGFNTALAALMEHVNELYKLKTMMLLGSAEWTKALKTLLQLVAPFAPHLAEELWQQMGEKNSIHISEWPKWDESELAQDTIEIVVQVNGKLRGNVTVPTGASEEQVAEAAQKDEKVAPHLAGKSIKKQIYVDGRLINFVI